MRERPESRVDPRAITLTAPQALSYSCSSSLGIVEPADSWAQLVWGPRICAYGVTAVVTGWQEVKEDDGK